MHKTLQLVDITGIGIRQVWNMRAYVQDLARLLSGSYPEILDRCLCKFTLEGRAGGWLG